MCVFHWECHCANWHRRASYQITPKHRKQKIVSYGIDLFFNIFNFISFIWWQTVVFKGSFIMSYSGLKKKPSCLSFRKHKNVVAVGIIFRHWDTACIWVFPTGDKEVYVQHHGRWWAGYRGLAMPTCTTTHAWRTCPWSMPGSLTSDFPWRQWRGKRSRHSRRMRNPEFYVSGKRPMVLSQSSLNVPVSAPEGVTRVQGF